MQNVSGMHIHLAQVCSALIYKDQDNLYSRINIVALLVADVNAMIKDAKRKGHDDPTPEDKDKIDECWKVIEGLRTKYDPLLDSDDCTDRSGFDMILDDIILKIVIVISDYDLLKSGAMGVYQAPRWGSGDTEVQDGTNT